jgi:hypothetical protein
MHAPARAAPALAGWLAGWLAGTPAGRAPTQPPHHRALQVLERAIAGVTERNTDPSNPSVGVVRLSGALHADERSAFVEFAHQLCR